MVCSCVLQPPVPSFNTPAVWKSKLKNTLLVESLFFIDSKAGLNHTCFMILLKYLGLHQSQFVLFAISI